MFSNYEIEENSVDFFTIGDICVLNLSEKNVKTINSPFYC